jgi:hypothetical protein
MPLILRITEFTAPSGNQFGAGLSFAFLTTLSSYLILSLILLSFMHAVLFLFSTNYTCIYPGTAKKICFTEWRTPALNDKVILQSLNTAIAAQYTEFPGQKK